MKINFYDFQKNNLMCDCIILIDNTKLNAHKIILSSSSLFFFRLLNTNMIESKESVIRLRDIDKKTFFLIFEYFYTEKIEIFQENVFNLISLSSFLQIDKLINLCCDFLIKTLDSNNCFKIREIAQTYSLKPLFKISDFFIKSYFEKIIYTKAFLNLYHDELFDWLNDKEINVSSEKSVLEAINLWVNHNKIRKIHQVKLLSSLKTLNNPRLKYESNNVLYAFNKDRKDNYLLKLYYNDTCHKISYTFNENVNNFSNIMIHCNIFLVGGFDQLNPIKSVKRFDLLSKTLINIASLNNCGGYLAIAAFDDYLYAAGGNKTTDLGLEAVNYFELYDHIKDKWVDLPIMKIKRSNFQLVALNNSFFAIGGRDSNFRALSSVEKYDVKNKK